MKLLINKPIIIDVQPNYILKAYDFEERKWMDTKVVAVNGQKILFESLDGLRWSDDDLINLQDPSTYDWKLNK